ncbi:MAG TPA: DUF3089 domain-containing protein [Bacteroidia bacterium]|jgi:hypothetical protein|nr:DUF3089 domain-containing protein [Bacteroidia bacterium]
MKFIPVKTIPVSAFVFSVILFSCLKPHRKFEKYTPPPVPDYSLEKNWAALPWTKDSADVVPLNSGLKDDQANAKVDVFFIHPTLYFRGKSWNADVNDEKTNHLVDKYTIREQASVFNASCRVFAPRYRQATLMSFTDADGNGRKALDTAYSDVKRAFEYYLKNYNNGRPFIIASHSQGSFHAERLIKEIIDKDTSLYKLLVAAYVIGGSASKDMFTLVTPCLNSSQTGCYVAWHSRKWNTHFKEVYNCQLKPGFDNCENYQCVNPLTWTSDTAYAPASLNLGSVPKTFDRVDRGIVDAKISPQNIVWSHPADKPGYIKGDNYHVLDYGLYYMNLRANVAERVGIYLSAHK